MQHVDLVQTLNPHVNAYVDVSVPEGFALAQCPPKGRGALARWLAGLPNGSILTAVHGPAGTPAVALVKHEGRFVDYADLPTEAKARVAFA